MTVTQEVEAILRDHKQARNSDKALMAYYMQKSGMNLTKEQLLIFKDMPSMETIRRIRQKLQESGKYEADAPIATERQNKANVIQQNIPKSQPKDVEKHLEARGYVIAPWHGDQA